MNTGLTNLTESSMERRKKSLIRNYERIRDQYAEEALFTYNEFISAYREWNRKDEVYYRRCDSHEIYLEQYRLCYSDETVGKVYPQWMGLMEHKQLQCGNFLESIYNCPHEIHELVADETVSEILRKLKPEYKEIIFYEVLRDYTIPKIAELMGQSERNIRKKKQRITDFVARQLYVALQGRENLSSREQAFIDRFEEEYYEI